MIANSKNNPDFKGKFEEGIRNLKILLELSEVAINQHWRQGVEHSMAEVVSETETALIEAIAKASRTGFYQTLDLKQLLRSTVFVSSYAFLEGFLDEIAAHLQSKYRYTLKLKDLNGKGVLRSKKYMLKVIGISDFFGTSQEWQRIQEYAQLRHGIVHASGRVLDDNKRKNILKYLSLVQFSDNFHIKTFKGFCRQVLDDIEVFAQDLFSVLDTFDRDWQ